MHRNQLKELKALVEPHLARAQKGGAWPGAAAALMLTATCLTQIAFSLMTPSADIVPRKTRRRCTCHLLLVPLMPRTVFHEGLIGQVDCRLCCKRFF